MQRLRHLLITAAILGATVATIALPAAAEDKASKPNILVIWGDDIGQSNISAYTRSMLGVR